MHLLKLLRLEIEQKYANGMKKFPEDPKKYNPVRLLNHMKPGLIFIETIISSNTQSVYQVKCEIDNIPFTGQGLKKKAAKMECCIAAIKYFWQFDFHAEVDLHDLQYKLKLIYTCTPHYNIMFL
ncbi:uncharacterized protein LOC132935817 [Metopolophium dirhodum]|uniref:uncharacterized protein LOC132935817 n=1 Tax=Metopolophium dirhodum TaxID=44670 RepID=UPI00298F8F11|nr:uncharacterized protein LOC132935817 [Metopolophium dirhodum]